MAFAWCVHAGIRPKEPEDHRLPGPPECCGAGKPERGFEPLTPCLQDRCSDQLSYSGAAASLRSAGLAVGGQALPDSAASRLPWPLVETTCS